ncbi:hypothetical protein M3212_05040 [Alkalihalobacillus oceani]|uniref:hypothetical protein n=1 Tax=Halalkalibacter oceani TaxID=1653776 RepID=UPI0020408D8D|nr:hypothetical protein [Halalkalibacter oceani]MCM3760154.1 hypothetical protein [Halalkalibacter oceani]
MKKIPYKVFSASAMAAVLATTAVLVAPVQAGAEEVAEISVDSVAVTVGEEAVVVDLLNYATAIGGGNAALLEYLKDGNEYPSVASVKLGDKYISLVDYAQGIGQDKSLEEIAEESEAVSTDGYKEFVDFDEDGAPIFEEIVEGLTVEAVSAIETTIVEVTFPELAEALEDATVEVTDSEGNVREVVAQDLAKGATVAQFDFVEAVDEDDLVGVWAVNGVEYSFDELKLVEDIVEEANKFPNENQVKLFDLLTQAGIQNLDADKIADYAEDIEGASPSPVWVSDVQKIIDEANKSDEQKAAEAAVVKAVVDATNQIQLLAALEANFERVNKDWITDYANTEVVTGPPAVTLLDLEGEGATGYDAVDFDGIQEIIDDANEAAIDQANADAEKSADQAKVTALIEKWVEADDPETPNTTPKADAIAASKAKEAAFRVAEANTENSLFNALVAYANATEDSVLKASELNANLKAFYFAELDKDDLIDNTITDAAVGHDHATNGIKAKIVSVANDKSLDQALNDLGEKATDYDGDKSATNKAAFQKALQQLANYTSHYTEADEKFLMSTIDDALLEEYADALKGIDDTDDVDTVQQAVKGVNDDAEELKSVKAINEATTASQVKTALDNLSITSYINIPSVDKLYIAEKVLEARADETDEEYDDKAAVETALTTAGTGIIAEYEALIAEFKAEEIVEDAANNAKTTTEVIAQLNKLSYDAFDNLTAGEKAEVAEYFQANYPTDDNGTVDYKTLASIKADIDKAIAAIQ